MSNDKQALQVVEIQDSKTTVVKAVLYLVGFQELHSFLFNSVL